MKTISIYILLLFSSFAFASEKIQNAPRPKLPTIFFLSRVKWPYDSAPGQRPTINNAERIVAAALHQLKLNPYPSDYWENIIILDEGKCWFVSFCARGNGRVQKLMDDGKLVDASGMYSVDMNAGIYLDKMTLKPPESSGLPRMPIRSLPLVSPSGDIGQGSGYVFFKTPPPNESTNWWKGMIGGYKPNPSERGKSHESKNPQCKQKPEKEDTDKK